MTQPTTRRVRQSNFRRQSSPRSTSISRPSNCRLLLKNLKCVCLFVFLTLGETSGTRSFRPFNTGRGFGGTSQALSRNRDTNDFGGKNQDGVPRETRPGSKNANDNTQFFETTSHATLEAATIPADDGDEEAIFFDVDQTDFPSELPPTESPMPTAIPEEQEPTMAPSFLPTTEPCTSENPTGTPISKWPTTEMPTQTSSPTILATTTAVVLVDQAPPKQTSTEMPTLAPTRTVAKEATSANFKLPSSAPTEYPTKDPLLLIATPSTAPPTEGQTMSSTPAFTWSPTKADTDMVYDETWLFTQAPNMTTNTPIDNIPETATANANFTTPDTNVTSTPETQVAEPEEDIMIITQTPTTTTTVAPTAQAHFLDDSSSNNSSTEPPTGTPTTLQPTFSTVGEAEFPLSGQLFLRLGGITTAFPGDVRLIFLATADEFIASASKEIGVKDIRVMLLYQRTIDLKDEDMNVPSTSNDNPHGIRRLDNEEILQVDLGVEGMSHKETFSASQWNDWLQDLFEGNSWEFLIMLQEMGDVEGSAFFDRLETVQVVERTQPITTVMTTPSPTRSPTRAPAPATTKTFTGEDGQAAGDEGIPLVAIIGAAVGGLVFLMIGVTLIRYVMVVSDRKHSASSHSSNGGDSLADNFGPADDEAPKPNSRTIQPKPSIGGSSISSESYLTNSANHHLNFVTATMSSSNYVQQPAPASESDNASQMCGTITGDMSQMDNASYAYSLEPGIEPSVAGVPQSVAASAMGFSAYRGGSSVASMTSGASSFAFLKLPIGKNGSEGAGGNIAGQPTIDVLAPPGKLGIVIDTTLDGPVVHKVNPGSALTGKLKSGDIIVAIDDVDTRAMTAASITALMVKTANQRRKLTIVSPP